jgi:hypothetical protein
MSAECEPPEARVFSVRARADGSCVVRAQALRFEFEAVSPAFVEAQEFAERWRVWVRQR